MAEEMLYDSDAMRQFAGIELGDDRMPDETTILNFRHLLEKHQLTEKLFVEVMHARKNPNAGQAQPATGNQPDPSGSTQNAKPAPLKSETPLEIAGQLL